MEGWQTKVIQSRVLFAAIHSHATNSNCFPGSNCEILKAKAPSFYEYQLLNILKNKVVSWVVNYDPPPPHQSRPLLGIHRWWAVRHSANQSVSLSRLLNPTRPGHPVPCPLHPCYCGLLFPLQARVYFQVHSDTTDVRSNSDRWMDSVCRSLPRNALHV